MPRNGGKRHLRMHQQRELENVQHVYPGADPYFLRSVRGKGPGVRLDICSHNAVDRNHSTNPVRRGGPNVHVAHGYWPMGSGTRLQLRRLKSRHGLDSQTAPQKIPSPRPRPLLRTPGPRARLATQVSRRLAGRGPAAHLQPPVRTSVSTCQADGARLWRVPTKVVVSTPPHRIVSVAVPPTLPATPTGAVSAPVSPTVATGSALVRSVQAAHRAHWGATRHPDLYLAT